MKLENKIALITGGSSGIGKEIARLFLQEGAKVMIGSIVKEELADTQKELSAISKDVATLECDVTIPSSVKKLTQATIRRFKKIDVLVNAAGIYGPIGSSITVDFQAWKQTYAVNLFGTFDAIRNVVPYMKQQGKGKIVNFSGGGDGPLPNFSAYNSSKVAIVRLTETLAEEFKPYNIDINAIAPGPVNTRFLDEALAAGKESVGEDRYKILIKQKKDGGVAPQKTAEMCVFLASDESDKLSGKYLSVVWDDWRAFPANIDHIANSDIFTLRRVKEDG